ncbi:hypothetical protein [Alloactinosynnema sp. L-07]|uniref:hypothetical protein n=1 Tax=Alloactinosynnema sp. L-07 TaxID=1653480 RepID=UPI00065EF3F0|nr:hypothetical protein [Alloactinosynnema sp. L-07]CRK61540.1 hypothetical protein [Alloactinosynnema sp. L-07]
MTQARPPEFSDPIGAAQWRPPDTRTGAVPTVRSQPPADSADEEPSAALTQRPPQEQPVTAPPKTTSRGSGILAQLILWHQLMSEDNAGWVRKTAALTALLIAVVFALGILALVGVSVFMIVARNSMGAWVAVPVAVCTFGGTVLAMKRRK